MLLRRVVATAVAVIAFLAAAIWSYQIAAEVWEYLAYNHNIGGPLSAAPGPRPLALGYITDRYFFILRVSLAFSVMFIAYFMAIESSRGFNVRLILYGILLLIILPLNVLNYSQGDMVLSANFQSVLNLMVIFLGATVMVWLWSLKVVAPDARVAKVVAIALLLFGAILVPLFFTLLWSLYKIGIMTKAQTETITWEQICATGGVISGLIAVAEFWHDSRKRVEGARPS